MWPRDSGLRVPKVGNGRTLDLNGTNVVVHTAETIYASGCTFSGGSANYGGAINAYRASLYLTGMTISGNSAGSRGGGFYIAETTADIVSCVISGNNAAQHSKDFFIASGRISFTDSTIGEVTLDMNASASIRGSNHFDKITSTTTDRGGPVTISSGASITLTNLINPGGGITVKAGGCMINNTSFGSPSSDTVYTSIISSGGGARGTLAS